MAMLGRWQSVLAVAASLVLTLFVRPGTARGHCDGLDGPVVTAGRQALERNDLARALIWVRSEDEPEIREAFERTRAVRGLGARARELADRYFFETLVRVHRAGEGAPYTGLKPAGRDLGPAIPAADRALETGNVEPLVSMLARAAGDGVRERFAQTMATGKYSPRDVEAGRRHVREYVSFIHYVERLHQAAASAAHGHEPEADAALHHEE